MLPLIGSTETVTGLDGQILSLLLAGPTGCGSIGGWPPEPWITTGV